MKKLICILLSVIFILNCTSCNQNEETTAPSDETVDITNQILNNIELQKNTFVATIKSVAEKDALITKYNLDITEYTVYTAEVSESIDGYTPIGEILLYWVGSSSEFASRAGMKKNETYVIDAESWVYGDEIIYLLSPYAVSFPRIDTAGQITIEQSDGSFITMGDRAAFVQQYYDLKTQYGTEHSDFYSVQSTAARFIDIFTAVYNKNSDTSIYDNEMYNWRPDSEFIELTKTTSENILNELKSLVSDPTLTEEKIKEIFKKG